MKKTIPCVVAVAGWGCPSVCWDSVRGNLDVLAKEAHKDKFRWRDVCWADLIADDKSNALLAETLASCDGPAVLVGWSLGGMLALGCAVENPSLVRGLVLVSTTSRFCKLEDERTGEHYPGASPRDVRTMQSRLQRDPQRVLDDFVQMVFTKEELAAGGESLVPRADLFSVDSLVAGLDYLLAADFRKSLGKIKVPVHIIHGTADRVIPFEAGTYLEHNLLNATLRQVGHAGHGLVMTHPLLVAKEICDALL